ncbi:LuxR C-terminal-related transcriptional regulator [Rhodococcus sp. NPDC060090]|uniref:helix-turn-helix transcriptional regulator n=1 Tax=Rhodococcus sp. NPDC060090 TaxID=3347056 RepID=UPI00365BA71F
MTIAGEHWVSLYTSGFPGTLGAALVERIPAAIADGNPTIAAIRRLHRQFAAPRDVPIAAAEPDAAAGVTPAPAEVIMRAMTLRIGGYFTEAAAVCDAVADAPVPVFETLDDSVRHAYAFYYLHIGITYLLADRVGEATMLLRRAHTAGRGMFVERDAAGKLALTYAARGVSTDAQRWIEEEQHHPPLPGKSETLVRPAGVIAAALVALDRLDPDAALNMLTELRTPADHEEFWAFALYVHGHHALLTGMPADGLRHIEAELQRYPTLYGGVSGLLLDVVRADLNLALGHLDRARHLIAGSTHPLTAPVRARACLLRDDPAGAEALVHHYSADPECGPRVSMELAVLGAAAACALGHRTEARRHLDRASVLSRQTGTVRPWTMVPSSLARELTSLGIDFPVALERMVGEFVVFPVALPLVRLTPRERVILDALVSGGSAATIADAEFVSVNTVKTQLRSLYKKLGVRSRRDALATARSLGPH